MTLQRRQLLLFATVLITILSLFGSGWVAPQTESASAWKPLQPADRLIGPARGNPEGVVRLALTLGSARPDQVSEYAYEIYRLAPQVGLDPAILIAQSALETGYWKGKFWKSSLNPAGIGIYNDNQPHSFYWANGVDAARGHIYHMYSYAVGIPQPDSILYLYRNLTPSTDGITRLGYAGTKQTIQSLEGSWALMPLYARGLCNKGNEILQFIERTQPPPVPASLPVVSVSATGGNDPARTLDGSPTSNWAVAGNAGSIREASITYYLGAPVEVEGVDWIFGRTGAADYLSIRSSVDGVEWTTQRLVSNAPAGVWQHLDKPFSARFIRLVFKNPNAEADLGYLAEIAFSGFSAARPTATITPTPSPTEPPAYSSMEEITASGGNDPYRVRDGLPETSWAVTGDGAMLQSAWITVDLGEQTHITSIGWQFRKTGFADYLSIRVSSDGATWTTVKVVGNAPAGQWATLDVAATAQYVRFYFRNPNSEPALGYLSEIQVHGYPGSSPSVTPTATPATGPVILTGMPIVPIGSGGSSGATPSKSIWDGNLVTDWRTTTSPPPSQSAEYVDLGGPANITGISLYFSEPECGEMLTVQTALDKSSFREAFRTDTGMASQWRNIPLAATARYVRFMFTGPVSGRPLGCLAEVEVLGTGMATSTPVPTATKTPTRTATSTPTHTATLSAQPTSSATDTATPSPNPTMTDPPTLVPTETIASTSTPESPMVTAIDSPTIEVSISDTSTVTPDAPVATDAPTPEDPIPSETPAGP